MKALPKSVLIDGLVYPVNSDFRVMLEIEDNVHLPSVEFAQLALTLFYGDSIPQNLREASKALYDFRQCKWQDGTCLFPAPPPAQKGKQNNSRVYDFNYDFALLYAAFLGQYHVNLWTVEYLHWFEFRAMFSGLDESTRLSQIMSYRGMDTSKMDAKQRAFYNDLKRRYALPPARNEQEYQKVLKKALKEGTALPRWEDYR